MKTKPLVSVIIPAYNEEKNIAKCLDALCRQNTQHSFEVILVDNNCTDNTSSIAKSFSDRLDLKIIPQPQQGRGAARMLGHKKATGDFLFSTDADAIVPEGWIESYMRTFSKKTSICAVTSSSEIYDCSHRINVIYNVLHPLIMHGYRILFRSYLLCGYGCAIRKNVYVQSGGFSNDNNGQEDVDLTSRIRKYGIIHYAKDTPVTFSGRRFQHGLLRGYWEYIKVFINRTLLKRKTATLSDKR